MGNRSQVNDIFYLFILYFFILQVLFVYITAYRLVFWGVMCVIVWVSLSTPVYTGFSKALSLLVVYFVLFQYVSLIFTLSYFISIHFIIIP